MSTPSLAVTKSTVTKLSNAEVWKLGNYLRDNIPHLQPGIAIHIVTDMCSQHIGRQITDDNVRGLLKSIEMSLPTLERTLEQRVTELERKLAQLIGE